MATRKRTLDEFGTRLELVVIDSPSGPKVIELKIACDRDHPSGITTTTLQSLTATDLARRPADSKKFELDRYLDSLPPHRWVKGARNTFDKELLRQVSLIYELALLAGAPPTKTIQDWLGSSRPTASRAIKQACDAGLLQAPTRRGIPASIPKRPR